MSRMIVFKQMPKSKFAVWKTLFWLESNLNKFQSHSNISVLTRTWKKSRRSQLSQITRENSRNKEFPFTSSIIILSESPPGTSPAFISRKEDQNDVQSTRNKNIHEESWAPPNRNSWNIFDNEIFPLNHCEKLRRMCSPRASQPVMRVKKAYFDVPSSIL